MTLRLTSGGEEGGSRASRLQASLNTSTAQRFAAQNCDVLVIGGGAAGGDTGPLQGETLAGAR